jgi:S1-C subfamily serine protease
VTDVVAGGPCDKAGIRGGTINKVVLGQTIRVGGDLIVGIDGNRVQRLNDISVYVERNKRPGDQVAFAIIRSGQKQIKVVTLGVRPAP